MSDKKQLDKNSLVYWFSKTKDMDLVPQPETIYIPLNRDEGIKFMDEEPLSEFVKACKEAAEKLSYPVFIRTDQASSKHNYERAALVKSEDDLEFAIAQTIEFNFIADFLGLPFEYMVFRKFIPLYSTFKAFKGLPIAKERRYFINDGKIVCHHPYWPEDAIRNPTKRNWKSLLKKMNHEDPDEIQTLTNYAELIAKKIGNEGWSIDFACHENNQIWYFIDAALAKDSYHPEDCSHYELFREKPKPRNIPAGYDKKLQDLID